MERYALKLKTFVEMGRMLAQLSVCKRLQVAAMVFPTDCSRVYAIGYNGPPRGVPHDACSGEEGGCGCVHAEANAIAKFNSETAKPSIIFTTHAPCVACAGLIINCDKIVGLIWDHAYRNEDGLELIRQSKRICVQQTELLTGSSGLSTAVRDVWRSLT